MHVRVGTSGYSYKEWKGPFYPKDLPPARFLGFYASRLATVEVNNTFYRMPTDKLVEGWAAEAPETFTFAVKAPQRITHIARLKNAGDSVAMFVRTVRGLGPRLGPLLFVRYGYRAMFAPATVLLLLIAGDRAFPRTSIARAQA